jgi:hypothetical protein
LSIKDYVVSTVIIYDLILMTNLKKYFDYLAILDKSNKQLDLDAIDELLLNVIAKASYEERTLNVKDLLGLKEVASQATIHGRLKKLAEKKLISLKVNGVDGRVKEVMLTKLANKRFELLSKTIDKA